MFMNINFVHFDLRLFLLKQIIVLITEHAAQSHAVTGINT